METSERKSPRRGVKAGKKGHKAAKKAGKKATKSGKKANEASIDDYTKWTVNRLFGELVVRGLPSRGKKQELVDRLKEDDMPVPGDERYTSWSAFELGDEARERGIIHAETFAGRDMLITRLMRNDKERGTLSSPYRGRKAAKKTIEPREQSAGLEECTNNARDLDTELKLAKAYRYAYQKAFTHLARDLIDNAPLISFSFLTRVDNYLADLQP